MSRSLMHVVVAVIAFFAASAPGLLMAQEKAPPMPTATAPADTRSFTFGPTKPRTLEGITSVRQGFAPVVITTDYTKERGYGFVGLAGDVKDDWVESRGKAFSRARTGPNDLLNGWIAGGPVFQIDVPAGKYLVTTSLGDWGEYEFFSYGSYTLLYNGKEAFQCVRNKANKEQWIYKQKYTDYERGQKLFDRYVKARFDVVTQEVDASEGKITVQARVDAGPEQYTGTINYVIVSPAANKDAHAKYLTDVENVMRASFDKRWPASAVKEAYCDGVTPEEKDAGFAILRNPGEKVYPWTFGSNQNHVKQLHAFGAWGQFEAVDFAVLPLKKLGAMTCTASDLEGPGGAKIPASEIQIGYVKYWDVYDRSSRPPQVSVEPYLVMDRNVLPTTEPRLTRQWWLTVHVPDKAAGGTYKGTITLSTAEGGAMKVPLAFDVLPAKLESPGGIMLLNYSFPWGALYDGDEAARWADIEKELRFQKDHGMNSVAVDGLHVPVSDDDTAQWEKFIDLYQKVAFDQPIYFAATMNMYGKFKDLLDPKQQDEYCAVLKKLETVARKRNQKVFYSLCDETTNDGREAIAELVATFTKAKVPEIARIGDINGYRELTRCAPYLNAAGFNNGWQGSFGTNRQNHDLINRTVIERVKAVGCEPWFVNGGVGRYPFGVFFWKMESLGVRGKCEWHYYASTSDPYNPLDSNQPNAFGSLVFPTCIPTLQMEDSRQGIDDLRYVRTLQQIVSAAKGKDMPRLQADRIQVAKEALDFWLDQLPDKMITAHTSDGAAVYTGSDFPPARMAEFRSEMAWHLARILKLDCPALCPSETRIASWEKDERTGWTSKIQSVAEHATDGSQSGKMVFDKPGVYFDTWGAMKPKDWRGYSSFRFDIFNPQDKEISLVMVVRDQLAACVNAEASARKTVTFKLKSGNNPLSLSLADLTDDAGKRSLDMTCIFNIYFNVKDAAEGTTLFVDNMRLVQNE